jgi:hypothetical protein
MRRIIVIGVLLLIAQFGPSLVRGETVRPASPIFGVTVPNGYRDWKMIAVAHEAGPDDLRGVLGNDAAVKAYQQGTLPFPDGTILVKLELTTRTVRHTKAASNSLRNINKCIVDKLR